MSKPKPRHKRTIALELLQRWKQLLRKGDPEKLREYLKEKGLTTISKPTIDKAIIYGCVHQQAIIDGINTYFAERLMGEKRMAEELGKLKEHAA